MSLLKKYKIKQKWKILVYMIVLEITLMMKKNQMIMEILMKKHNLIVNKIKIRNKNKNNSQNNREQQNNKDQNKKDWNKKDQSNRNQNNK